MIGRQGQVGDNAGVAKNSRSRGVAARGADDICIRNSVEEKGGQKRTPRAARGVDPRTAFPSTDWAQASPNFSWKRSSQTRSACSASDRRANGPNRGPPTGDR